MHLGHSLTVRLSHQFTCFVCRQPITLHPMTALPVDPARAVAELREGTKPTVCISCGADFRFSRSRAAFRRYLQFLAMHVSDDGTVEELEGMA